MSHRAVSNWLLRQGRASGFSDPGRNHETTGNRGAAGRRDHTRRLRRDGPARRRGDERKRDAQRHLVISGVSGTRTVISSVLAAKGVFRGVGRIVELPDLPTDPPNFSRDDLVFSEGTMHLISATVAITSFSQNPRNCLFRLTLQQTGAVRGGTGQFTAATGSFTSTVSGQ